MTDNQSTEVATPIVLRGNADWVEVMTLGPATLQVAHELRAAADDYERLADDNAALRAALRRARTSCRESKQYTTRQFAVLCGVTPTKLCEWTGELPKTEPDFMD